MLRRMSPKWFAIDSQLAIAQTVITLVYLTRCCGISILDIHRDTFPRSRTACHAKAGGPTCLNETGRSGNIIPSEPGADSDQELPSSALLVPRAPEIGSVAKSAQIGRAHV